MDIAFLLLLRQEEIICEQLVECEYIILNWIP